ncbi:MAG: hypothetical protein ABI761_20380 [Saprospiraceae bacterium]
MNRRRCEVGGMSNELRAISIQLSVKYSSQLEPDTSHLIPQTFSPLTIHHSPLIIHH